MPDRLLRSTSEERAARQSRAGVIAIAAIVAAGTAAQLIDYGLFDLRFAALDSATDGGVFGVVGDLALVAAATTAWLVMVRVRDRGVATVVLPPLLTFLAADKVLRLHDHIPHWLVLYLPLLAATFAALASLTWTMPPRAGRLLGTGLGLLAVSFLLHLYGERLLSALGVPVTGWGYQIKAVVKHGAEVAGWLLVALGLGIGITVHRPDAPPRAGEESA